MIVKAAIHVRRHAIDESADRGNTFFHRHGRVAPAQVGPDLPRMDHDRGDPLWRQLDGDAPHERIERGLAGAVGKMAALGVAANARPTAADRDDPFKVAGGDIFGQHLDQPQRARRR